MNTTPIIFDNKQYADLVQSNASDDLVARSAWVSNVGEESRTKDSSEIQGLINFLYRNFHHSPFEHGQFTFYIKTPLFVAREFMRHRTFSFNEVSGRYSQMKPRFYTIGEDRPIVQEGKIGNYHFVPGSAEQFSDVDSSIHFTSTQAWNAYTSLKENGIANEVARDTLTLNLYTEFYASVNPRNLMHFLDLRRDPQALKEIRDLAEQMERIFSQQMPLTYKAWNRYKQVMIDTEKEQIAPLDGI